MADKDIETFKEDLLLELRALETRRRDGIASPSRDEVITAFEASLREPGLQPYQVYLSVLGDRAKTPGFRSTAVNLLHDPNRVPESAAPEIADTIVAVMQEPRLDYRLGLQTLMAASILRSYEPPTLMLPIPRRSIDDYFVPFAKRVPFPRQGQSQPETDLGHTAHTLAPIARLIVVHGHVYDDLLESALFRFYEAQVAVQENSKIAGKLKEGGFYAIVHPMEHLAELMDQGARTKDGDLVKLLLSDAVTGSSTVVREFDSLNALRTALDIKHPRIPEYLAQRDNFLMVAGGMGHTHF